MDVGLEAIAEVAQLSSHPPAVDLGQPTLAVEQNHQTIVLIDDCSLLLTANLAVPEASKGCF